MAADRQRQAAVDGRRRTTRARAGASGRSTTSPAGCIPVPASGKPDPGTYELCLLHHECPTDPAPALVTDCDTRIECKPGAIEERFRLEVRWPTTTRSAMSCA